MATMNLDSTNHIWNFTDTFSSNTYNVVFDTQNKFLDAKIKASLTVTGGAITPIFDSANSGLLTYFTDDGTAADNSIHITPQATNTAGFIALHNSSSPVVGTTAYYKIKTGEGQANTANVVLYSTDGSKAGVNIASIVGTAENAEPESGYYLSFTGSGSSKIKTSGWMTAGTTLTAASKTRYFPITAALISVSKTAGTITPSTTLSKSDSVTWSTTDTSGIWLQATGNGSVSNLNIKANVSRPGYIPSGDVATANGLSIAAASTPATEKRYITGVTVASGKSFSVTNSGTTTVTAGIASSTPQGVINIVAYPSSGTTADASKKIVDGGRWVETTISAANTWYYGKVKAAALTVTTSSTNTNMSTYFNSLSSSSGASVTITPKYTNTAGFKTANSTATNNGGTTYWKIKTTSITQNNTTVTSTDSDSNPTAVTRGTATWGTGWITENNIGAATFKNAPTSGVTYIDISKTDEAPILTVLDNNGGGYLYIDKGYVDNLKISLARLIPDTLDGNNISFAPANYILTGYAAFDAAGAQITGTMQIYNGAYTVS